MTACKDNNPPKEWEEQITEKKTETQENGNGGEKPSYTVTDRRFWANGEEIEATPAEELVQKPAYVQALEEELKKKDETLREYISQYKSAKAQMNEAIQRIERDKAREINFRIAELAKTFLSILDDLESAVKHIQEAENRASVAEGLVLINQRIKSALEKIGIEEVEALGKPHDPTVHDAVAVDNVTEQEKDGVVLQVLKKGYKLGDVLVRPAAVVVGKYQPPSQ